MTEIITTLEDVRLIAALEANLEEEMMNFGRVLAGAEVYNDGEIEGFYTGRGHLNGILRTHLRHSDPESVKQSIDRALAYFRAKKVGEIGWSVGQDCQPARLAAYLERLGFSKLDEENVGMALDMAAMRVEEGHVEGLEIRELLELKDLNVLRKMEIEGFGSSEVMAGYYCEMYENAGFGPGSHWRHLGGWWRGEVVAATSLLFHAGVAGIYGVATVPHARQRGIARALVLRAISIARQADYRIAILSPTDMSEGIYRRLGFREYTRIRHYTRELPSLSATGGL
ncbi:MAG TPA: GNAT family N-acetyltransferase [Ktedonobacteraceae bacterium]